jgi:hypothetical protein
MHENILHTVSFSSTWLTIEKNILQMCCLDKVSDPSAALLRQQWRCLLLIEPLLLPHTGEYPQVSSQSILFIFGWWCGLFFGCPSLTYLVYVSWFSVVVEPKAAVMALVGAYIMGSWLRRLPGSRLLPVRCWGQEWIGLAGAFHCLLLLYLCYFAAHFVQGFDWCTECWAAECLVLVP